MSSNTTSTSRTTCAPMAPSSLSVAVSSSPWENDESQTHCANCVAEFTHMNRRHHCRICGKLFCQQCSSQKALIPPSSIVLLSHHSRHDQYLKKSTWKQESEGSDNAAISASFAPNDDPEQVLSLLTSKMSMTTTCDKPGMVRGTMMLYAKGLEERYKLAREPLRVCHACHLHLMPLQDELRATNSNAVRFNTIDPTSPKRLWNSPLAFTLGHEIRKAAYTLNNLLPLPKRMALLIPTSMTDQYEYQYHQQQHCATAIRDSCSSISPNLGDVDGVRIPARLLNMARGIAIMTVIKGGFGFGVEFGSGLVVARLDDGQQQRWSAPSAIGMGGVSWGALVGAQVSDILLLLMTDEAVNLFSLSEGAVQLGADLGVAVGPLGRSVEGNLTVAPNQMAPVYTYSISKGLYAGVSLDGKMIFARDNVNEKFYGMKVHPRSLLSGDVPTPPAAQPLYDAIKRCRVYATNAAGGGRSTTSRRILTRHMSDNSVPPA